MRFWTSAGIGVPLACLLVFKYAGFAADNVSALANAIGIHAAASFPRFILPVGISFYTFQTLSYVIDVRRGTIPAERHFGFYALFVSFFPQLVAGPIERPGKLIPQLRSCSGRGDFANGLGLMLLGFFKKLAVADYLAQFVEPVYADPAGATGPAVILATVFFAVQIYCDFSGYSDIACGAAGMLGIRLTENFRLPYSAGSLHEFWRRWHISLTSWLTDYIYIPLGGSRRGTARQLVNIMIVFAVSGLWHGADWTFVIWGLLHGTVMCLEALILAGKTGKATLRNESEVHMEASDAGAAHAEAAYVKAAHAEAAHAEAAHVKTAARIRRALTFMFVCFTWIFFRAASASDALLLVGRLFHGYGIHSFAETLSGMGMTGKSAAHIMLTLACLILLDKIRNGEYSGEYFLPHGDEQPGEAKALFIIIMVMTVAASWLMLLAEHAGNVFIYFRF